MFRAEESRSDSSGAAEMVQQERKKKWIYHNWMKTV